MTPKEKAKELVEKYMEITNGYDFINDAKKCALICVDEMLDCNTTSVYWEEDFEYWKQVRQEIENYDRY
jgi:hypothetical protein